MIASFFHHSVDKISYVKLHAFNESIVFTFRRIPFVSTQKSGLIIDIESHYFTL